MTRMQRSQRRYTPRRQPAAVESGAVHREAERLARQAERRLRLSDTAAVRLEEMSNPIDRLEAVLDIADDVARTAPAAVVEWTLPCNPWWRKRLGDLRAGRTFQMRKIVTREDGSTANVPMYPEGEPA